MACEGNRVKAEILQQGGRTTLVLTRPSITNPKRKVVSISVASGDVVSVDIVDPDIPVAKKVKAVHSSAMDQTAAASKIPGMSITENAMEVEEHGTKLEKEDSKHND